ncbi:UNVERIFIED_CONTAM: Transcription factor [Sesamum calycinum]|uniref:Transcription factor n=1 Tax=Sesamum calycinum TaxID=2727403 RepID=A0AAW2J2U9_9LAMI
MRSPSKGGGHDGVKKGPWMPKEDKKLIDYIQNHGHGTQFQQASNGVERAADSGRLSYAGYQLRQLLPIQAANHPPSPFASWKQVLYQLIRSPKVLMWIILILIPHVPTSSISL